MCIRDRCIDDFKQSVFTYEFSESDGSGDVDKLDDVALHVVFAVRLLLDLVELSRF